MTNEPDPIANHAEVVTCPHCGATVEYQRGAVSVKCHYCGQAVSIPNVTSSVNIGPAMQDVLTVMEAMPTTAVTPQSRRTSAGCVIAILGFVGVMILATVVLPIVLTNQALNSIPHMPAALQDIATTAAEIKQSPAQEPTRRPPTAVPTPAFAEFALQFGSTGMGPGQFTNAHAGGMDGEGHLYVGEYTGGRIQVFDSNGKFLNQFFAGDEHTDLLGFAVDRKGVVYVADGADIIRYNGATGKTLGKLKYSSGPGFGELALAPDGSLYAMWYERRNGIFTSVEGAREDLVRFDSSGNVIKVIKGVISSMTDNVELDNALTVDGRGNVYLAASFEDTIFKFDANGKFITRLGSSGEGSSQFGSLGAIAVDGQGRIFVVDSSNITVLKPDGSLLDKIQVSGAARSLTFDDTSKLLVVTDDGVVKYQVKQK
jgi:DNA-binding beta-propeller fold protein YncE